MTTTVQLDDMVEDGRDRRNLAPRSSWGDWKPPKKRDSLGVLEAQHTSRVASMVPLRRARMAQSAFAHYRGAAAVMAADLETTPVSGITVQACGDAHLVNFGFYASPERALVFDLNDFDETLPGPFEWDVARLAASAVVAARANGFDKKDQDAVARAAVTAYGKHMRRYASMSNLAIWYEQIDAKAAAKAMGSVDHSTVKKSLAKTRSKTSDRLLAKLTMTANGGTPRIVDQPPLITHIDTERWRAELADMYASYVASLSPERSALVERFRRVDFAVKIVGVGSVGTMCFAALLLDASGSPLFLQVKEAQPSVLAIAPGAPKVDHDGARVVHGQRIVQAVSDPFLGWARAHNRDFYVRQLQDMKGSVNVELASPAILREYLSLCGWVLARAHARSGQATRIAGYLGKSDIFEQAMAGFAVTYANINQADHARLNDAIADGRLEATSEPAAA